MALTPKQRTFAQHVASGTMNLSDACRAAYNAENMSGPAIRNEASLLMTHPEVAVMVERLRTAQERAYKLSDRERVLQRLRELLEHAEGTAAEHVTLRACDLLGKTVGLCRDVAIIEKPQRSSEEIEAEFDKLLAAVMDRDESAVH